MRSAALIFGLLAGLFGCGVIAFGNLETGLSTLAAFGTHRELIAKFAVYLIPNIGFLGAGMALAKPKFGGFLMLLSAAAWAGAAFVAGHGAVLFAALPFTFVAAGGLVALFARPNEAAANADSLPPPRNINRWSDEPETEVKDERPRYTIQGPGQGPGRGRTETPPPSLEDDEPDEAPPETDRPRSFTPPEPTELRRGTPEVPLLPEPRDEYFPERQPRPPSRSQEASAPGDFALSPEDFPAPQRRNFDPPRPNPYQEFEPYDPNQRPERRGGTLRAIVRVINLILFVALVGGAAAAVYYDYSRGPKSLLFGSHQGNTTQTVAPQKPSPAPATPAPAATPASDSVTTPANSPGPTTATANPAAPAAPTTPTTADNSTASQPVPLAPTTDTPPTPDATPAPMATPAPTATASANATVFNDPGKYCATVDTIDAPDSRFTGAAIPPSIAAALQLPASADPSQAHWRCVGKAVYACYSTGAACNITPTVQLMVAYCAQHPDAQSIPAPNGFWNCNGKRPVIPSDQKWPADARGFYGPAWTRLPDAGNG